MAKLSASVGRGGVNRTADVRLVQGLLNNYPIPGVTQTLKVDGKIGNNTYTRIETFQKKILNSAKPDGRVDVDGRTYNKLVNRPNTKLASSYSVSSKALDLLKSIEELAEQPYDDQTGKDITSWVKGATIGYGHLIAKGDWSKYKNGITKAQAETLFKNDLAPFVSKVKSVITARVTQNEFDAMVILIFNIGKSAFASSSVAKLVNNPGAVTAYANLEKAWMAWNKSQGKYSKGLVNRRKAEWKIYTKGIYAKW